MSDNVTAHSPAPASENDCKRLAIENPCALIAAFPAMKPTLLSFAAEHLGRHAPASVAVPALAPLLSHEKDYVREGALMGLSHHAETDEAAANALRGAAANDPLPVLREMAADMLEPW